MVKFIHLATTIITLSFLVVGCKPSSDTVTSKIEIEEEGDSEGGALDPYTLKFFTEVISSGVPVRLRSGHSIIWLKNGSVYFEGEKLSAGKCFYVKGNKHIQAGKSGAEIWRWDFSSALDDSKSIVSDFSFEGAIDFGVERIVQSSSSTFHNSIILNGLDSLVQNDQLIFRLERVVIDENKILNSFNGIGAAIAVLVKGDVKILYHDRERERDEVESNWVYKFEESSNIAARSRSEIMIASILPSKYFGTKTPLPSIISKANGKAKGSHEMIVDIRIE